MNRKLLISIIIAFLAVIIVLLLILQKKTKTNTDKIYDEQGTVIQTSYEDVQSTKKLDEEQEEKTKLTGISNFGIINILSDKKLLGGEYLIDDKAWSPDSQKIFLTREEGMTDIGLPAYKTYDIYNLNSGELSQTNIQDGITLGTPRWDDVNSLITPKDAVKLVGNQIQVSEKVEATPPGYELLEEVKYCNSNLNTCKKYVSGLTFSQDNKYAAFISPYNGGQDIPYSYRLFILPQDAESLDELIWFNQIPMGAEVSTPEFRWSKDNQYLITGNNTMFDIETQEAVVPPAGYKRIYLSPDESKVVIFSVTDDSQGKRYNRAEVKVKNLIDNSEQEILIIEGDDSGSRELVWLDGSFSPDGKHIVFAINQHIWIAHTETGKIYRLTDKAGTYRQPRWSPDGKNIIYTVPVEVRLISLNYPELDISN